MTDRYSRIAITLPPEDLAAADRLAKALDRSRSWVVAEAIRRYVAEEAGIDTPRLDPSRAHQLQRDLALTAEERVRAAEEIVMVPRIPSATSAMPRVFATYDEFAAWRRERSGR